MTWTPEDAEIRRNALRLYRESEAAELAVESVEVGSLPEEARRQYSELEDKYAAALSQLRQDHRDAVDAVRRQYEPPELADLKAKAEAAAQAYEDAPGPALMTDWSDQPIICAASGLPIWEDEQIVRDDESDEVYIRAALGLPPRPIEDEEVEEAA